MTDININDEPEFDILLTKEEVDNIIITLDPSMAPIIGVIGDDIYMSGEFIEENPFVFVVEKDIFMDMWKIWINTKREVCETPCSEGGYFIADKIYQKGGCETIILPGYNEETEEELEISIPVIRIYEWDMEPDFDH